MSADLADELARARAEARVLDAGPWRDAVTDVAAGLPDPVATRRPPRQYRRGWKVSALSAEQQRGFLSDRPVAGAMFAPFVQASPARLSVAQFIVPLLECEVAFVLGTDLPQRSQPYTRGEIEAAIEAVVPAIEVADCRCPADAPEPAEARGLHGQWFLHHRRAGARLAQARPRKPRASR